MDSGKVRLIKLTRCFRVLVFRFPVSDFRFRFWFVWPWSQSCFHLLILRLPVSAFRFFYAGCGASAGSGLIRGL